MQNAWKCVWHKINMPRNTKDASVEPFFSDNLAAVDTNKELRWSLFPTAVQVPCTARHSNCVGVVYSHMAGASLWVMWNSKCCKAPCKPPWLVGETEKRADEIETTGWKKGQKTVRMLPSFCSLPPPSSVGITGQVTCTLGIPNQVLNWGISPAPLHW